MDSEDRVMKEFMSKTIQEDSAMHKMLNRFISSNSYSKYQTRLQQERLSTLTTLSNMAVFGQTLVNRQHDEINALMQLASHGTPSCQLTPDELSCSESNVHFVNQGENTLDFQFLAAPFKIQDAMFVNCLYRPTGG